MSEYLLIVVPTWHGASPSFHRFSVETEAVETMLNIERLEPKTYTMIVKPVSPLRRKKELSQ